VINVYLIDSLYDVREKSEFIVASLGETDFRTLKFPSRLIRRELSIGLSQFATISSRRFGDILGATFFSSCSV